MLLNFMELQLISSIRSRDNFCLGDLTFSSKLVEYCAQYKVGLPICFLYMHIRGVGEASGINIIQALKREETVVSGHYVSFGEQRLIVSIVTDFRLGETRFDLINTP